MYRNEAFTESLYVDMSGVSLDSVFGMAALKDQLKKIVTIQNDKNFVYLHKRNFEISNNRLANEKIRDLTNAMLSRGTKNAS